MPLTSFAKDQQRLQAINELQGLIDEGMQSGEPRVFDVAAFIKNRTSDPDA